MRGPRWWMYMWPGLATAWSRGDWAGLLIALAFGCALDLTLLASWVWSEWTTAAVRTTAGTALVLFWIVSWWVTIRRMSALRRLDGAPTAEDLFPLALDEYLRGNLVAAEANCQALLERTPRDAEALLLLATVLRHAGRNADAGTTLSKLEKLDAAANWRAEIADERRRLEQRTAVAAEEREVKQPEVEELETEEVESTADTAATAAATSTLQVDDRQTTREAA